MRGTEAARITGEGTGHLAGLVDDGGASGVPDAHLSELSGGMGVGPSAVDPGGDGETGDMALAFFQADAVSQGYDCQKPGCSRCGKHFADYCRVYGIISSSAERQIRAHEWSLFGEDSTWVRE